MAPLIISVSMVTRLENGRKFSPLSDGDFDVNHVKCLSSVSLN